MASETGRRSTDRPTIVSSYDATHWHESYSMLADAVGKHLAGFIVEDDVAEESILIDAIENAGLALAWRPIATAPRDGTPIRVFWSELIDEDFNPSGSVEAYYQADEGWVGAVWNNDQDCWDATPIRPTHWTPPLPAPEPTP